MVLSEQEFLVILFKIVALKTPQCLVSTGTLCRSGSWTHTVPVGRITVGLLHESVCVKQCQMGLTLKSLPGLISAIPFE